MISRRKMIQGSALAAASFLSGCGLTPAEVAQFKKNCADPGDGVFAPDGTPNRLYIDSHCHLMSSRDSDQAAFVARKFLSDDWAKRINESSLKQIIDRIQQIINRDYRSARTEANRLLQAARTLDDGVYGYVPAEQRIAALCSEGRASRWDLVAAREGTVSDASNRLGNGRTTGFVTSRTRNAALMMAQFPKVDLFIPSIVDFYEGLPEGYSDPARQMQFYTALAIVSQGRFLPMVSFNPERYFEEIRDRHAHNNLDLVRNAIEVGGAIGVKVHPSSGFDPHSNAEYAQLGQKTADGCHDRATDPDLNAERYAVMDAGMRALYDLCSDLDVPILTHSGTSIGSASQCMFDPATDPDDWTNSTHHWAKAMNDARPTAPRARVMLAHFAGGFGPMRPEGPPDAAFKQTPYSYDPDTGALVQSEWLQTAVAHIAQSPAPNMYIDTSVMDELAYSQAVDENSVRAAAGAAPDKWDIRPGLRLSSRKAIAAAEADGGRYARRFRDFVQQTPALHDRLIYGSDLHMQSVATVSAHDAYLDLIEAAIPDRPGLRDKVMGANAATLFGLRQGNANRRRIESFLEKTGTDLRTVRWMQKLDALGSS